MRLVLRVLFFEFALSWALVLAGWIRVAVQVRPFLIGTMRAGVRHGWRVVAGLLVAVPAVGWPLLFRFSSVWAADVHKGWLNAAIPWWLLIGVCGSLVLVARVCEEKPRPELRSGRPETRIGRRLAGRGEEGAGGGGQGRDAGSQGRLYDRRE
jgi:hypothetical protein